MGRPTGGKVSTSVKIEGWQAEWLDENSHYNASELFRQFISEMAQGGRERADGLAFREAMLEAEVEELEERLARKRDLLQQVREHLEEREGEASEAIEDAAQAVKAGHLTVSPESDSLREKAQTAGMTPEAFADALADHLDGEEWTITSDLKSIGDRRVRFDRGRLDAGDDPLVPADEAVTDGGAPTRD